MENIIKLIEALINFVTIGFVLSTISRYTCEGILNALGISTVLLKRIFVFLVNVFITYYAMFVLYSYTYYDAVLVLLFVCAGTEALHNILTQLKKSKEEVSLNETLAETTEYHDEV